MEVNPVQLANIKRIQEASQSGRLVLFVGAGVSKNSGVPVWGELIAEMKKELPKSIGDETDDLKVALLYKDSRGHKEYMEKIKEVLMHNKVIPNPIHEAILALNPTHIITTNYDDLIEQEIEKEYKQFAVVRCDKDLPNMTYPSALIKMHGDYDKDNIVLAEKDYYNYARNFTLIRAYVQSLFASKMIVFVGFSFADLNLKMILNEVQTILEERMQPVYLLSLEKPDEVTARYFENKGITIVYLSEDEVKALIQKREWDYNSKNLKEPGIKLYDYLQIIVNYDFCPQEDIIEYIYAKASRYKDELRVFGSGIKYLFPPELKKGFFNEHSSGLQTGHKYFSELAKRLKSFDGRRKFVSKHGLKKCREYILFAFYNYLYEIDGLDIIGDNFYKRLKKYVPDTYLDRATSYLSHFDFDALQRRLRALSIRELDGTIMDMELPYTYYKIGSYYRAYLEFNKILPMAWKRQKYILYFLCLYNIWSLRYAIRNELWWAENNSEYGTVLCKKLCKIDLNETLTKLPLPKEIKSIFQDLIANRYIGNRAIESEELKDKLHQQRKSSERGGVSINSNIVSLLGKYEREKQFSENNFVLTDFNSYFPSICRSTISGVLNSYATKDSPETEDGDLMFHHNTRLESFDSSILEVMLWGIDTKTLRELFRQYEIYDIEIDENGSKYLQKCIANLSADEAWSFGSQRIFNAIKNLLYVTARSSKLQVDVDQLYKIVMRLWDMPAQRFDLENFLSLILEVHQPTVNIAKNLLTNILSGENRSASKGYVEALCNLIGDSGEMITGVNRFLDKNLEDSYLAYLYRATDAEGKKHIVDFAKNCFSSRRALYFHFWDSINQVPNSVAVFKKRLKCKQDYFESNNILVCYILSKWRKDERFSAFWKSIDIYSKKDKCLQFFLDPFNYPTPEEVPASWIRSSGQDIAKELMNIDVYKERIKQYIAEARLSPQARSNFLAIF